MAFYGMIILAFKCVASSYFTYFKYAHLHRTHTHTHTTYARIHYYHFHHITYNAIYTAVGSGGGDGSGVSHRCHRVCVLLFLFIFWLIPFFCICKRLYVFHFRAHLYTFVRLFVLMTQNCVL